MYCSNPPLAWREIARSVSSALSLFQVLITLFLLKGDTLVWKNWHSGDLEH